MRTGFVVVLGKGLSRRHDRRAATANGTAQREGRRAVPSTRSLRTNTSEHDLARMTAVRRSGKRPFRHRTSVPYGAQYPALRDRLNCGRPEGDQACSFLVAHRGRDDAIVAIVADQFRQCIACRVAYCRIGMHHLMLIATPYD